MGSNLQQLFGPGVLGAAAVERGSMADAQGGDGDGGIAKKGLRLGGFKKAQQARTSLFICFRGNCPELESSQGLASRSGGYFFAGRARDANAGASFGCLANDGNFRQGAGR